MRNSFSSVATALLLTSATASAAAAVYEPLPQTRPVIVTFGDSLTAGFGLDPSESYPSVLQRMFNELGYRYEVQNQGVSGDTTQDGLARVPTALAARPKIVVLELGANDGLRGQPISGIETNLAKTIEAFQKAKVKLVLAGITLPPNYGQDYIKRFTAIYPAMAKKYKIPLIPFLLSGVAGNPSMMQRDGLHPTAEGARVVAQSVFKTLQPMLKK